jgi:hypothetical protein
MKRGSHGSRCVRAPLAVTAGPSQVRASEARDNPRLVNSNLTIFDRLNRWGRIGVHLRGLRSGGRKVGAECARRAFIHRRAHAALRKRTATTHEARAGRTSSGRALRPPPHQPIVSSRAASISPARSGLNKSLPKAWALAARE